MATLATLAVGIFIATLSVVLNNKTRDKIDAVARELCEKVDAVDDKLYDLAQRVTVLEVKIDGIASLPLAPAPRKTTQKTTRKVHKAQEAKPKVTADTRRTQYTRVASPRKT